MLAGTQAATIKENPNERLPEGKVTKVTPVLWRSPGQSEDGDFKTPGLPPWIEH
jgi:hypothetical protein